MKLKETYFKSNIEPRYCNVVFGIGNYIEGPNDYYSAGVSYNYNDFHQVMYSGGYPMPNVPGMLNSYYHQNESIFPNMSGTNYNYTSNMMYNYPQNQFMDGNSRKKLDTFVAGKGESRK